MFEITNTFTNLFENLCSGLVLVLIGFVALSVGSVIIDTIRSRKGK